MILTCIEAAMSLGLSAPPASTASPGWPLTPAVRWRSAPLAAVSWAGHGMPTGREAATSKGLFCLNFPGMWIPSSGSLSASSLSSSLGLRAAGDLLAASTRGVTQCRLQLEFTWDPVQSEHVIISQAELTTTMTLHHLLQVTQAGRRLLSPHRGHHRMSAGGGPGDGAREGGLDVKDVRQVILSILPANIGDRCPAYMSGLLPQMIQGLNDVVRALEARVCYSVKASQPSLCQLFLFGKEPLKENLFFNGFIYYHLYYLIKFLCVEFSIVSIPDKICWIKTTALSSSVSQLDLNSWSKWRVAGPYFESLSAYYPVPNIASSLQMIWMTYKVGGLWQL